MVVVNEIEHNSLAHQGLDGVQRYFHDLIAAFLYLHITIDHIIMEGGNVVAFTNTTGTRAQQLMFAAGIPMPGNDISFKTATFIE